MRHVGSLRSADTTVLFGRLRRLRRRFQRFDQQD